MPLSHPIYDLVKPISEQPPCADEAQSTDDQRVALSLLRTLRDDLTRGERGAALDEESVQFCEQWQQVADLGCNLLVKHSKDLRVVAWICEALARTDGTIGLTKALKLLNQLCLSCWEQLLPGADEPQEDAEGDRIRIIEWLLTKGLDRPVYAFSLVKGGGFRFMDLIEMQMSHPSELTVSQFLQEVSRSDAQYYKNACDQIDECVEALENLLKTLSAICSVDPNGLSRAPARVAVANLLGVYRATLNELRLINRAGGETIDYKAISRIDISQFSFDFVEPELAISGTPRSARDLETTPFTAILSVCDLETPRYISSLSREVQHVCVPFQDGVLASPEVLTRAVQKLAELRANGQFTLVHCAGGISRSPTVVALYLMARDDLSWDEAVIRVRAGRKTTAPSEHLTNESVRNQVVENVRRVVQ